MNAFLFSSHGLKYLKALLKYHVVANHTLYSDAYHQAKTEVTTKIPKGIFHVSFFISWRIGRKANKSLEKVDLPTQLDGKSLSIDVGRFGRLISIIINGFTQVTIEDGIAADGVIQVVSNVIIPPKQLGGIKQQWQGEELTEAELMERLEPFVEKEDL